MTASTHGVSLAAACKICSLCKESKPLSEFHRQPSGKHGRHSWCADCFNAKFRGERTRKSDPLTKRQQNYQRRYGLTAEQVEELLQQQGGMCAICSSFPVRPVVDHDHATGRVRGVLCHGCNIQLPAIEDHTFFTAALAYLKRVA